MSSSNERVDRLIQTVNTRMPDSVTPATRIQIHPAEWTELVHEILELRARPVPETSAPPDDAIVISPHCNPPPAEPALTRELLKACVAYHDALDQCFAWLVAQSPMDKTFYPSKCGWPWETAQKGVALIKRVRGQLKTSPPQKDWGSI